MVEADTWWKLVAMGLKCAVGLKVFCEILDNDSQIHKIHCETRRVESNIQSKLAQFTKGARKEATDNVDILTSTA